VQHEQQRDVFFSVAQVDDSIDASAAVVGRDRRRAFRYEDTRLCAWLLCRSGRVGLGRLGSALSRRRR
jgi:hypothetical protein